MFFLKKPSLVQCSISQFPKHEVAVQFLNFLKNEFADAFIYIDIVSNSHLARTVFRILNIQQNLTNKSVNWIES